MLARFLILFASILVGSCAGAVVKPSREPSTPKRDALLVLPGFGYTRTGERALRSIAPALANEGIDLFVPSYVTRAGLAASRTKLERFIREHRLDRYERLHVFAFIAGAWTFNPLAEQDRLPNLANVVYDRSPFQERAPQVAAATLPVLAWVKFGSTLFDVARTPYEPLRRTNAKIALLIESTPTSFIRRHEKAARKYGPFAFDCDAFGQRYDDCMYLPMSHDELYVRFAEVWPEIRTFITTGRFGSAADRTPPAGDPLARQLMP